MIADWSEYDVDRSSKSYQKQETEFQNAWIDLVIDSHCINL